MKVIIGTNLALCNQHVRVQFYHKNVHIKKSLCILIDELGVYENEK